MLFVYLVISIILSCILLKWSISKANGTILNVFYISFYTFQLFISFILLIKEPDFELWNDFGTELTSCIPSFCLAVLIANFAISIANYLYNGINKQEGNRVQYITECVVNNYSLSRISICFLIGFLFTIISSLNISYIVAVFALSFSFSPLLIGLLWRKLSQSHKLLWTAALLLNLVFHSIQGSRGTAIFPIVFIIIGYLISIYDDKRLFIKRLIATGMISLLSIPFLSFIADYRNYYGRNSEVSFATFEAMIDYANDPTKLGEEKKNSISRLLIHPNLAAVYYTPEMVPYREFEYLSEELLSIINLSGEEGRDNYNESRSNLGYGLGVPTRYGFTVTDETSVEWSVFADGYSRFGYLGLFLYSFLFALLLLWIEKKCLHLAGYDPLIALVLFLFILYNGVLSYMYSYYAFLKLLIFRLSLVSVVTYILCKFSQNKKLTF